ncbi:DNA-directed RNA polymerases I, II, and III subunit RPABC3 [Nematocida displodere]|uniref:DNA-directed RNA polymerases I, II, and III subunit RPABC3 n=1 Tax=Nematocida displodere TaxID=1805483 RepID=A0A177EFR1_9MICR|nr:DNA-directed RNA polymerases I, II, and III subunit RPABC3 [Nematocida displodere]
MRIYSDTYTLSEVDKDGKVFDDVSRGYFKSSTGTLYLDYHSKLFPFKKLDRIEISIFSDENGFSETDVPEKYEYLMGNGVLHLKKEKNQNDIAEIYFSGLLALLETPKQAIKGLEKCKRMFIGVAAA